MIREITKKSLFEFLYDSGTLTLSAFAISNHIFGYLAQAYWYTPSAIFPYFSLMIAIVVIPSNILLFIKFRKFLAKDRSPIPNHHTKGILAQRLLIALAIWMILALQLIGLAIFVYAVFPDAFHVTKSIQTNNLIYFAEIFTSIGIPSMVFYWFFILNKKEVSRQALFTKKLRC